MALEFNGSSNYLNVGNVLNPSSSATITAWFVKDGTGVRQEIISKEGPTTPTGWELSVDTTNVVEIGFFDGSTYNVAQSTTTISANVLYHVAGVYDDAADQVRIYINGALETTTSGVTVDTASNTENVNIGRRPNGTRYFDGEIEDVRFYDRALTTDEILTIYSARGSDFIIEGLSARWTLTEGPPGSGGSSILNVQTTDATTNSNTLTLSYTVPSSINSPVLVVSCTGDDGTVGDCVVSSVSFGATGMNIRAASNTTTFGNSSTISTLGVNAGDSATITITFTGGIDGRSMIAYTVTNAIDGINTSGTAFNNGGNSTTGFTTTALYKLGLTHLATGDNNAAFAATGTGHSITSQVLSGGNTFSAHAGSFDASAIQSYSGYGFSFFSGPVRSSIVAIALNTQGLVNVPDRSGAGLNATIVGATYSANIALNRDGA